VQDRADNGKPAHRYLLIYKMTMNAELSNIKKLKKRFFC